MQKEVWRPSNIYPDLEISSLGRVRGRHFRRKLRKPVILPYGPKVWCIRLNRTSRYVPIYTLMNDTFDTDMYGPNYRPLLSPDPPEDVKSYNVTGDGYVHIVGTTLFFKTHKECAEHLGISKQSVGIALKNRDGWVPSRRVRLEIVTCDDEE